MKFSQSLKFRPILFVMENKFLVQIGLQAIQPIWWSDIQSEIAVTEHPHVFPRNPFLSG